MPKCKLTDSLIPQLSCPKNKRHLEFFDTKLPGFYLDVLASGKQVFRVRYRQEGKQRVKTLGDARLLTVKEVRKMAKKLLRKLLAGGDPKLVSNFDEGPSLNDFFLHQYLPYVKSYKRSWETDEIMLRLHLLPALGDRAMTSLQPPEIARVVEAMKAKGYAPGTINRMLVLLRYGYNLALRWKLAGIETNPAQEVKNLRCDNKIERYLTPEQTRRLMECVAASPNPDLADIVGFLLLTGARLREALTARWQDINWRQRSWRIPKTKTDKIRHLPLSRQARRLLKKRYEQMQSSPYQAGKEYIFSNPRTGKPFVSIFHSWNTARCAAGLPELRLHDLRHSFASFLVNAGRSLYEVQELLGHSDIRTTSRYAHVSRDRLREAVEVVQVLN